MSRARLPLVLGLALACMLAGGAVRALAAAPPEWLIKVAAEPTPAHAAGAPALVLLDHDAVRLDGKGRLVLTRRRAVRILSAGGEKHARAFVSYLSGRDTAKGLGAWLVRGGKEFKPKSQTRDWVDELIDENALFSEYRAKTFSYADIAAPGDVFGFEATVEGGTLFADQINIWRSDLPALAERYDLTLPPGWTLTARVDGERPLVESRSADGLTWSWVLRDRPFRPDEPYAAEDQWFDARVLITLQRPAGTAAGGPVSFARWSDLSAWNRSLAAGQCDRDAALVDNAARLTAGIEHPLGRMRALSRHVQQLRYVAVNSNIGIGFGYRPRKATEVHTRGWGDCKDKANLLCAMLREVGVTAHLAIASVGYGRVIAPDWPNPQQFNHAIVAIPVDASVDLPAVVETARFGRVLFFDATDPTTMLGDLPMSLQGSSVFILAEGSDELTILPRLPVEQNRRFERRIELLLTPAGIVAGLGTFSGRGQAGAGLRSLLRRRSAKELEAWVLESLGAPLRGAVLKNVKVEDDPVADEVKIRVELAAPKFCQFLPGNLALVKLDLFTRMGMPAFPNRGRVLPMEFEGMQVVEQVEITLPDRFAAEELPSPVVLKEPFATYENRVRLCDGVLGLERVLTIQDMTVPVADYARVRQFLGDVAKADKVSVVLRTSAP